MPPLFLLDTNTVSAVMADHPKVKARLSLQGYHLSDNDLWIAAAALSLGAILVSNDRAFSHVPG